LSLFTLFSMSKLNVNFRSLCFLKLSELIAFELKLISLLQKKSVTSLLYPLIFYSVESSANLSLISKTKALSSLVNSSRLKIFTLKTMS
jgi:hypothetical protein